MPTVPRALSDAGARLQRRRATADGVDLAVVDEGGGPAVLLLHGWPDSADLWRGQLVDLVTAGFRVIAPDLRGFGASDAPDDVDAYRVSASVRDMVAVLDALDLGRVDVVGHDWGAAVAWAFALRHPERTRRLTAMSVGHPATFGAPGPDGTPPLGHLRRQWYALLFQFEDAAERWLADDDWRGLRALVGPTPEVDRWIADLARPGALRASLNWYRANSPLRGMVGRRRAVPPTADHIDVLGLWGDGDQFLVEEQMRGSGAHVGGRWRYERVDGAGHWLQLDRPDDTSRLLVGHLTA